MSELTFKSTTHHTPLQRAWEARKLPLLAPIWLYKKVLSPLLPPACRHHPTCSEYAFMAIKQRGVLQGSVMATWRVLRCNPFGTKGYDPVEAFRWPWQPRVELPAPEDQTSETAPMPSSRIT
ncbi:MAG: membrane protein insertion efficiency factor YidD [Planctomycetes bacterium]|nr:membrane protein insertion efficiency factor YidD [Planctomycetota bacterium]